MKNVDMKFVTDLLAGLVVQYKKKKSVAARYQQAIDDLAVGKPEAAAKVLRDRLAFNNGSIPGLLMASGLPEVRKRLIEVQDIVRLAGLALDRLAEEYPPAMIWGALYDGRQADLKVQRANESLVIGYFRGRAEVCKGDPTNASEIYQTAAAQLEVGNPNAAALLLQTELENCDSDSRLRELAPKLRQMLDYLCEIYGPYNIWGENEDLIARHIDAALDRVRNRNNAAVTA